MSLQSIALNEIEFIEPPPIPVITTSRSQGDTLGGDDEIDFLIYSPNGAFAGDGLVVMFGEVEAASFVVDDDTQITAVPPAHVAGDAPVTVINASGTSNAVAYEYWSPDELQKSGPAAHPNLFLDASRTILPLSYAATIAFENQNRPYAKGDGVVPYGYWGARRGPQVGNSDPGTAPAVSEGAPDFVTSPFTRLYNSTYSPGNFTGTGDQTWIIVAVIDGIVTAHADYLRGEGLLCSSNGNAGLVLGGPAGNEVIWWIWNAGTYGVARVTLPVTSGRYVIIARKVSNVMQLSIDGGATWVTGDTKTGPPPGGANTDLGQNATAAFLAGAGAGQFNGRIRAAVLNSNDISDVEANKVLLWAAARHP